MGQEPSGAAGSPRPLGHGRASHDALGLCLVGVSSQGTEGIEEEVMRTAIVIETLMAWKTGCLNAAIDNVVATHLLFSTLALESSEEVKK